MIFEQNIERLLKGKRLLKYPKEQLEQELRDLNRPVSNIYHPNCFKYRVVAMSPGYLEDAIKLCYFAILKFPTQGCIVFDRSLAMPYGVYGPKHYTLKDFNNWLRICISIHRQHEQRTINSRGQEGDRIATREDGYTTVNNLVETPAPPRPRNPYDGPF